MALPIKQLKNIGPVASILRSYFKFIQLPDNYILTKPPLPKDPNNLSETYQNFFPVRKRSQLPKLKEAIDSLKIEYLVPSKLPDEFFELPPPKLKLPGDYRDLPYHLSQMFPISESRDDLI